MRISDWVQRVLFRSNILDAFHQADQPVVAVGPRGREADAAIAHDDGGDAVPTRRRHFLVPRRLSVIMGMDVDEAGGDDPAARVDLFAPGGQVRADRDDAVAVDRDIRRERLAARAVRSEEHTSELQSLMRISYAVF